MSSLYRDIAPVVNGQYEITNNEPAVVLPSNTLVCREKMHVLYLLYSLVHTYSISNCSDISTHCVYTHRSSATPSDSCVLRSRVRHLALYIDGL